MNGYVEGLEFWVPIKCKGREDVVVRHDIPPNTRSHQPKRTVRLPYSSYWRCVWLIKPLEHYSDRFIDRKRGQIGFRRPPRIGYKHSRSRGNPTPDFSFISHPPMPLKPILEKVFVC